MAFFTVVWHYTDDIQVINEAKDAHAAYLKELIGSGSLRIAGPFEDGTGGILVFETADQAELKPLLDGDPYVAHGVVVDQRIYPFKPVLGALAA